MRYHPTVLKNNPTHWRYGLEQTRDVPPLVWSEASRVVTWPLELRSGIAARSIAQMMLTEKLGNFLLNIFENDCDHTLDSVFLAAFEIDLPAWVLEFSKKYACACQLWSKKHNFLLDVLAEARAHCIGSEGERASIDALERAVRLTGPKV